MGGKRRSRNSFQFPEQQKLCLEHQNESGSKTNRVARLFGISRKKTTRVTTSGGLKVDDGDDLELDS